MLNNKWAIKISLTSDCNFKCIYCNDAFRTNPKKEGKRIGKNDVIDILKAAFENGITNIQWTGGEPTIVDLPFYVAAAKKIGYKEQSLTTNGALLYKILDDLISSGLNRANISLDSLKPETFKSITGSSCLFEVLRSIEASAKKLEITKINVAIMKSNFDEIDGFVQYALTLGPKVILKFHELWKFEPEENYIKFHVPYEEIYSKLESISNLEPLPGVKGNNPDVQYYTMSKNNLHIGISRVPRFWRCGGPSCKKVRVYANGKTCDLRDLCQADYNGKIQLIKEIIEKRSATEILK